MPVQAAYFWKPSNARLVVLDTFVPVARASALSAPPSLAWPAKDPSDLLDFVLDMSPAVAGDEGDAIAGVSASISPSSDPDDLSVSQIGTDGLAAVLWLANGVAGTTYAVTIAAVTLSGRTIERTVSLPVISLSTGFTSPTDALDVEGGAPLVDQNGNPILVD
jgi:hypothetical protein